MAAASVWLFICTSLMLCVCVCAEYFMLTVCLMICPVWRMNVVVPVLFVSNCLLHVAASYIDAVNKLLIVHFLLPGMAS